MDSTLYYYNRAWDIIRDKTSPAAVSEKTRLLTSMAILLTFMGRDEESMQYADRAMQMAEHDTDMEMVMYAATNAGGIYARNRQFDKGTEALRTAMAKAGESGLPDKQLSALTMIVTLHKLSGQRDSVDYYMARAEKFAEQLPPESVAVLGFRETQAQVLRDMGRYAESNAIFRKLLSAAGGIRAGSTSPATTPTWDNGATRPTPTRKPISPWTVSTTPTSPPRSQNGRPNTERPRRSWRYPAWSRNPSGTGRPCSCGSS